MSGVRVVEIDVPKRRHGGARDDGKASAIDSDGRPRKAADVLLDIAAQHTLFHDPAGDVFARVTRGAHAEVYGLETREYRETLAAAFLDVSGGRGCNRNALADAVCTLSARARFDGATHPVWLRTARTDTGIALDVGDPDWQVIDIDESGWRIAPKSGVMFRRASRTLALPPPSNTPDFSLLWNYIQCDQLDRVLIAAFLLGALKPEGPYPLLMLSGEQGSGKSTAARILKRLADPSAVPLRAPPKEIRDLLVAARNGHLLCEDNLSWLPPEMSDAFCRLSTGGAISERKYFTNSEEELLDVQRPVIMNGIEELASRPDLAQRAIHVELNAPDVQLTEHALWESFERDAPHIFAALLDAITACVADDVDPADLGTLPRMADFACWVAAGIERLGFSQRVFMRAYRANQTSALAAGAENSAVGRALIAFVNSHGDAGWSGTATALLEALNLATDDKARGRGWPRSPRALSANLTRLGPALRACGIEKTTGKSVERYIELCKVQE